MVEKYQIIFWSVVSFAVLTALAFFILGAGVNRFYYLGLLSVVPLGYSGLKLHGRLMVLRFQRHLRSTWGKHDERTRDLDRVQRSYEECTAQETPSNRLDDDTWADLNMDSVYTHMDRTLTNPGAVVLYRILRCPETQGAILEKRNRLIRLFQTDPAVREAVQLELMGLGRARHASVAGLLWGRRPPQSRFRFLLAALALAAAISILTPFIWGTPALLYVVAPVFLANLLITHGMVRGKVYQHLSALRYLGALIRVAGRIAQADELTSTDHAKALTPTRGMVKIAARTRFLVPEKSFSAELFELLYEYVSVFFLMEARALYGILDDLELHLPDLKRLYWAVGELDALQSAASFRQGLPSYVEPELTSDGAALELRGGRHPLLDDPVPNSILTAARGAFVTGPNMAGKTTFLRTVAVNAVMAQSIYTCYASAYRASFFRVISSISHADALEEGRSYYLVEAERLLRIVRAVEGDVPCLCVVDELLMGTNWRERKSASVAILDYLHRNGAIVIVSSHDIDLAHTLREQYQNYHFADQLDDEGLLCFDHVLRKGVSSTQNAIRLLEHLDYPERIIAQARKSLKEPT